MVKEKKWVLDGIEYGFHKWKKQLILADKALFILVIALLGILRPDFLMIGVYLMLFPYLFLTARKIAFYHLFVSSLMALIWVIIAKNQYGYNQDMLLIFGLNSFPLFAWASGLFAAYLIYSHWEHKIKFAGFFKKILLFTAIYWPILLFLETISYHLFNIRNLATAAYVGLPICNCIHAPSWMQIAYFAMGPLYFGIYKLIGLENPHHIRKKDLVRKK